jgi:hypothetical protein
MTTTIPLISDDLDLFNEFCNVNNLDPLLTDSAI